MSATLFEIPAQPAPAPPGRIVGNGMQLRFCQREDVDALMHAIETGHNRPCCVAATGYGKMLLTAETAARLYAATGKVVCLVDRSNLVYQAADEWERHLGVSVGRVADGDRVGMELPFVVATVQAMYTPDRSGKPLYEYREFEDTRNVILDESHKFFAPCFRTIPEHFVHMNGAVIVGFTATPVASNGDEWSSFFNWTPQAAGPCMRTVPWCIDNGLLVPMRQAFLSLNLKLSDLYEKAGDATEDEDSDDASDIVRALLSDRDEQAGLKFAAGIAQVLGKRQSLIFSPARVESAKTLASWLKHVSPCDAVWGARADKSDVLEWFGKGHPQSLVNVNLLTEGANFPNVSAVLICRLLKSWRIVQQMVGRALRPCTSIVSELNRLDGPENASARRDAIAHSDKPDALVADLVGLEDEVIRASAVEMMLADQPDDVRREAAQFSFHRRKGGLSDLPDAELISESKAQLKLKQHQALAEMARRRAMEGDLPVDVSVTFNGTNELLPKLPTPKHPPTDGQIGFLVKSLGFPREMAQSFSRKQAGAIIGRKQKYKAPKAKQPDTQQLLPVVQSFASMSPSEWQRAQLAKLGHSGPMPENHAAANNLINALTARKMERVA